MIDLQDIEIDFGPDTDSEIELKRKLTDLQERYRKEAQPILDALAREYAMKAPRILVSKLITNPDFDAMIKDATARFPKTLAYLAESEKAEAAWPNGCRRPSVCSRHKTCMYIGCRHVDQDIASDVSCGAG